jgi:hypothetical protein
MLTVKVKSSHDMGAVQIGAPACAVALGATKGPPVYVRVGLAGETVPLDGAELGLTREFLDFGLAAKLSVARKTPTKQSVRAKKIRGVNKPDSEEDFFRMETFLFVRLRLLIISYELIFKFRSENSSETDNAKARLSERIAGRVEHNCDDFDKKT